jgi:hypothetical protein
MAGAYTGCDRVSYELMRWIRRGRQRKRHQNGLADELDSLSGQPNVTRNVQLALYGAVENSVGCSVSWQSKVSIWNGVTTGPNSVTVTKYEG